MRSRNAPQPLRVASYSSGGSVPCCSTSISVRPSPRSRRTTTTSSCGASPGWSLIVSTSRSGGSTSTYSPFQRISWPPWNIVARHAPPGRTSIATVSSGISASGPPNQSANAAGSVHSRHTRSRGAGRTRVIVRPRRRSGAGSAIEPLFQRVEAGVPEAAVALEPLGGIAHRRAAQSRRAQLRGPPALDQAGALEDAQVLGDGLQRDRERRGELVHRGLALDEPREDRPPGRVGQGGEGRAELVGRSGHIQAIA